MWFISYALDIQEEIMPVVHVVRDPKSVLLSSYLYHQQDPPAEPWLKNPKPDAMNTLPVLQKKYANTPYYKVLCPWVVLAWKPRDTDFEVDFYPDPQ